MKAIDRLFQYIEIKGINKAELERKVEVSNGYLAKQLTRKADIGEGIFLKILDNCPDINAKWLLTGQGAMLRGEVSPQEEDSSLPAKTKDNSGIPLVLMSAAAGFGSENFSVAEDDIQARYKVPDFNGIDFMVRVKGNSMYPKYSSGDVIACRKLNESKFIEWNKPHLIATNEHGLIVKRLRKSDVEGCVKAVSDNKDYDPFDIPQGEITGLAIIVGVIRLE